jgi:hypothetical protein
MRTAVLGAGFVAACLCASAAPAQPASASSPLGGDSPNATSNQQNPSVTFSTPGVKTITLTVCDASQRCSTLTQTLTVLDPTPIISGPAVFPSPVALNSSLTLTAGTAGQPPLVATWQLTGPGGPVSYPGPVAVLNPQQAGLAPGAYVAYLQLSNPAGSVQSLPIAFTVTAAEYQSFYTIAPCRALDTRVSANPLAGGQPQTVSLAACGLPSNARAAALNLTVVAPSADGSMVAWPSDQPLPDTSNLSYRAGAVQAAFSVVPLARSGATLNVVAALAGSTHLVLDVTGYFAP